MNHTLNYLNFRSGCLDEMTSIGLYECRHDRYEETSERQKHVFVHSLHNQYPHMKGVVYLQDLSDVTIKKSTFNLNDAGPVLTDVQIIGSIDNQNDYWNVQRASAIYLGDRLENVTIIDSTFKNNSCSFIKDHVAKRNPTLYSFFPETYFEVSHAPVININRKNGIEEERVKILSNNFLD